MLIRITFFLSFLALGANACFHAQNATNEPKYVDIRWKVGTEKTVTVHDTTLIYSDSELISSVYVKHSYKLKILSQKDSVYEVRIKHLSLATDFILNTQIPELDEGAEKFMNVINEVENSIKKFEFILMVDQNTGFAFEIKNEQKFLDLMSQTTNKIILELAAIFGERLDAQKRKELESAVKKELEIKSEGILKTTMNSLNYILQLGYQFRALIKSQHT